MLLSFVSTIAITGVCLGTAALIIALSILDGFEREIKEKVISFTSHIHVTGYSNKPLDDPDRSVALLREKIPGIASVVPYAAREGMIRYRGNVEGLYLKGIDLRYDDGRLRGRITEGRYLDTAWSGAPPIVLGRSLALKLGVSPGEDVFIFALTTDGSASHTPRGKKFSVAGIFESGMSEYDDVFAYTVGPAAADLFGLDRQVTGYDVMVRDAAAIDGITARIEEELGYPHAARSVFSVYRNLFSWAELQKKLSPVLLSLIVVVASVNIIGTMLMFVLEKSREIGVLRSVGASQRFVRRIFHYQGILIAVTGVVLGNLLGLGLCLVQLEFRVMSLPADIYYMDTVPIHLDPVNFVTVSMATVLLSWMTTYLPARAAGRIDPVRIFRFG